MMAEPLFNYTVLADNGHGDDTKGKYSPPLKGLINVNSFNSSYIVDDRFREYAFARKVVGAAGPMFKDIGINFIDVTPELRDIPLSTRVARINKYCKEYPNCVMVSTHVNAAGNGDWMNARGWSAWTTRGQNNSDKLAECLYDAAEEYIDKDLMFIDSFNGHLDGKLIKKDKIIRTDYSDGDRDYEANFAIIKGSNCPAVLVENFFMDNKKDLELLCDEHCVYRMIGTLVYGVNNFFKKYKGKK